MLKSYYDAFGIFNSVRSNTHTHTHTHTHTDKSKQFSREVIQSVYVDSFYRYTMHGPVGSRQKPLCNAWSGW